MLWHHFKLHAKFWADIKSWLYIITLLQYYNYLKNCCTNFVILTFNKGTYASSTKLGITENRTHSKIKRYQIKYYQVYKRSNSQTWKVSRWERVQPISTDLINILELLSPDTYYPYMYMHVILTTVLLWLILLDLVLNLKLFWKPLEFILKAAH